MKISTFLTMLLVVGIVLVAIVGMVKEAENLYGIDVNKTDWESGYNFASDVNDSVSPLQKALEDLGNEDKGWFDKIGSGFTGIISGVTLLPKMVGKTGKMGMSLITKLSLTIGVPHIILYTIIVMFIIWGIIELYRFFQRDRENI